MTPFLFEDLINVEYLEERAGDASPTPKHTTKGGAKAATNAAAKATSKPRKAAPAATKAEKTPAPLRHILPKPTVVQGNAESAAAKVSEAGKEGVEMVIDENEDDGVELLQKFNAHK